MVGGLAEDFYAHDFYQPTDLDVCAPLSRDDRRRLGELGFSKEGRHWFHEASRVAVEFPDERIDGDETRTLLVDVGGGSARLIGVDDLYLDRVRQATMTKNENDIAFVGAVAIAAARFEEMDWKYVRRRIAEIAVAEPMIGESMKKLNRRARTRAGRAISG